MSEGLGWLPVEARDALEEDRDKASRDYADRLLALTPRERLLALMDRAACRATDDTPCPELRPADLQRLVASFPGEALPDAGELAARYPVIVAEPA